MPIYTAKHYIRVGRNGSRVDVKPGEQFDFTDEEVKTLKAAEALKPQSKSAPFAKAVDTSVKPVKGKKVIQSEDDDL
jgi:hypothetical protein